MSVTWVRSAAGLWDTVPLDAALMALHRRGPLPVPAGQALFAIPAPLLARHHAPCGTERWTLLCGLGSRVRVNGAPVCPGVRVLADRDAIEPGSGQTVWFSAEELARVLPFPAAADTTCCIRCKLPMAPGTPAVRCPAPGCGFWHHQSDDLPCWTYSSGCAGCNHPTAFDAGFQWTPAAL